MSFSTKDSLSTSHADNNATRAAPRRKKTSSQVSMCGTFRALLYKQGPASRPLTIAHVINIRAHRNSPSCCCSGRPDGDLRPIVQKPSTPKKTNRCTSEVLTQSSLPTATADHRKHLKGVDRHLEHLRRRRRHGVLQHPAFVRGVVQVLVDGV